MFIFEPQCHTLVTFFLNLPINAYLFPVNTVALVESNSRPAGHQLVNSYMTNRNADPMDLVELAKQVQKVCTYCKFSKIFNTFSILKCFSGLKVTKNCQSVLFV